MVQRVAGDVVGGENLALRHFAAGFVSPDLLICRLKAVGGETEENHAQHRHEVVAGSEFRVGAEVFRGLPEVGLEFFDVLEGVVAHAVAFLSFMFVTPIPCTALFPD